VWPDALVTTSDTKSVDALTYGLSTLCLGSHFATRTQRLIYPGVPYNGVLQRPRRQDYATFTKKFSLGNGPKDWVAEYMINKESGKMLGTLAALAVKKMVNLETFVWDMPTGVLSEVFLALDSLRDHSDDGDCKLERVWVRWHDNSESGTSSTVSSPGPPPPPPPQFVMPLGSTMTPIGIMMPSSAPPHPNQKPSLAYSQSRVEFPTFSVLPPLRSLSVLDIDELAYLDEMSILIEQSKDRLQELRVGIATNAVAKNFVQTWDGSGLQQVDHDARWPGESNISDRRLGGVLGVLLGRVYDIRRRTMPKSKGNAPIPPPILPATTSSQGMQPAATNAAPADDNEETVIIITETEASPESVDEASLDVPTEVVEGDNSSQTPTVTPVAAEDPAEPQGGKRKRNRDTSVGSRNQDTWLGDRKRLDGKLKLQTLELERCPLSMQVCTKAIDWTTLTTLTLLDCNHHESLWRILKRQFAPVPVIHGYEGVSSGKPGAGTVMQYHLSLKSLHTNTTSAPLIAFLKETLAPNTLEVLFLQARWRAGPPAVTITQIFKGPMKRHHGSLKKLLIDSSDKSPRANGPDLPRWNNWVFTSDMVVYLTSGRMSSLRELAVSLDYRDWVGAWHETVGLRFHY
jgi:hypothetical protein